MEEKSATATEDRSITGAASVIGSATVLSRILGYARDAVVAYVFGAAMATDAFFVAFRISNLLRRLVGEGALTSSFVPIFTEELIKRPKEGARRLASSAFTLFAIILVVLTIAGVAFSDPIVRLLSPGFVSDPEKFVLTVNLTRVMFPYMVFIGLMAIAMGVLHSLKHFTAPAVAPVFFNVMIILSVVAVSPFLAEPVYALAAGVLMGGLAQFFIQVPSLKRYGFAPRPAFAFADPGIKRIFTLMGPAAFGVGVYQLNVFVTMWFASRLPEGSISYLFYGARLMELPVGVFGVAISTAALPSLSEYVSREDWDGFRDSLSFALRLVGFVTIPSMAGLLVLDEHIIDVLFRRGEFGLEAVSGTSTALFFYALGLVPVAVTRTLTSVFYSLKDTSTPVKVALFSFITNAVFCYLLSGPMGHGGLALAATLAATVNVVGLYIVLWLRFGRFGGRSVLASAVKAAIAAVVMGGVIYLAASYAWAPGAGILERAALLAGFVALGVGVYLAASRVLGTPELGIIRDFYRKPGRKAV